jgi:hypothetical protein
VEWFITAVTILWNENQLGASPLHLKEKCSISKQNSGSQDWEEGNFKGVSSLTGSLFFWAAFISPTGWSASSPCTTSISYASLMLNHTIMQHSGSEDWEEANFKGVSSLKGSSLSHELLHQPNWMNCILGV